MMDNTIKFTVPGDEKQDMRRTLRSVFDALNEKGYNPINQIVGYLLSEDPTYITNYNNARSMICKLDRDELLQELVRCYLFDKKCSAKRLLPRQKPLSISYFPLRLAFFPSLLGNSWKSNRICPISVDKGVVFCYHSHTLMERRYLLWQKKMCSCTRVIP